MNSTQSAPTSSIAFVCSPLILVYPLMWSGNILILDSMLEAHIDFGSASTMMRDEMRGCVSSFDLFNVPVLREGVAECQLLFRHVISETCLIALIL